jgi:hypothetical protein
MRTSSFAAGAIAAALLALPATLRAQSSPTVAVGKAVGKAMQITPYAGYMTFGNLVDGPLGTSLSGAGGALYGAQLGMKLAPSIAIIGNVGYTTGDLRVGVPLLGGIDVGERKALLADAGLQLELPGPKTAGLAVSPFIQAGAGVIRFDMSLGDLVNPRSTSLAGNVGAGADLAVGSGMSLRFMVKDYISKFDLQDAAGFESGAAKVSHNWALTAGLKLEF